VKVAYLFAERNHPVLGRTGASVHVLELCGAFAALGHDVDVLAAVRGDAATAPAGVRVQELLRPWFAGAARAPALLRRGPAPAPSRSAVESPPPRITRRPASVAADLLRLASAALLNEILYRRSLRILRARPPDLIYERHVRFSPVGVRLARALEVPLAVEVNASFTSPSEWWQDHSRLSVRASARLERRIAARADAVFCVSTTLRDHWRRLAAAPGKVVLLPNAAATERLRPDPEAAAAIRERLGIGDDIVIGFIGSMRRWHGADLMLRAGALVAARTPRVRLLLVGDGPTRAHLEALAQELGISSRAVFTGHVPMAEVRGHIAAMDIAAVPYPLLPQFHFSPLKLFECMAVGKPVVASAFPDIRAVVADGGNGILVAPGDVPALADALARLVADEELRLRLGRAARATIVRHHTWRANAEAILSHTEQSA
jgi:glycosyltransferase involved in cell wall biosynthesis